MCKQCADCATFELQPENVAPFHDDRSLFLLSQWGIPSWLYVAYRTGAAVLMVLWVLADLLSEASKFYADNYAIWFVFATNWSFLLLCVTTCYQACVVGAYFLRSKIVCTQEDSKELSIPLMLLWVLYTTCANAAMMVTFSYWAFLFAVNDAGFLITTMSRLKHTLNTVFIIFDLFFSAVPIRIFHVIYPLFLGAIYTAFNAFYFVNDGVGPDGKPYAYYMLDWRNPIQSAITTSMGFVITSLVQFVLYGIYRLRIWVFEKVIGEVEQEPHVHEDAMERGETESILQADGEVGAERPPVSQKRGCYDSTEYLEVNTHESSL